MRDTHPRSVCVEPSFYTGHMPTAVFDEARAIWLGRYVEREMDAPLVEETKRHLGRCRCCTQFLEELESADKSPTAKEKIPYAICPSSQDMDAYLLRKQELPAEKQDRIATHVSECPLCHEESEWLNGLGAAEPSIEPIPFQTKRSWAEYSAVAAALFFFVFSSLLLWRQYTTQVPDQKLRALAVVKEPNQINYAALNQISVSLSPAIDAVYHEGLTAFQKGDFEAASSDFEKVLNSAPNHAASLYLLGYSYYYLKEPEKAFEFCDRAERSHPHSLEGCLSLVNIALKTGHFDRAIQEIYTLHHNVPEAPEVDRMYNQIMTLTRGREVKL
ncbi:MAG TPA: tetratricopeptide repeat protein [Acidobacteriota bacterium]|nr:tetratricopeptide repeat protein [Acidobacteriota bacterium]